MIKNLKNIISCLFKTKGFDKNNNLDTDESIIIDVSWNDIINGRSCSINNSIISNAWKRNGYIAKISDYYIVLNNGDTFYPENLSDHWRFFIGSSKCKPKNIKYLKCK